MFEIRPYAHKKNTALYNPFREMDEWEKQFFGNPFGFFEGGIEEFKTDIKDEGDRYELEADLPGFDKKDIHLDVNGDTLTIHAERKAEQEEKDDMQNTEKNLGEQRSKKEEIIANHAKDNKVVHQLIDLALLQNGMLRGASLNSFIQRSVDLIK